MTDDRLDSDTTLAVVDRALAGGRATAAGPAERELEDLALALRAESPVPDDDFVRLLDIRVAEGFPKPERRAGRKRRASGVRPAIPLPRGRALALTGGAAVLLVVLGVALSTTQEDPATVSTSRAPRPEALPAAPPLPDNPAALQILPEDQLAQSLDGSGSGSGRGRQIVPGERRRQIERSAQMTLAAPGDELDSAADSIIRVTDRHRGFVLRSSVSTGDDNAPGGLFELRVPAASLQPALRDLSKLGHVRARTQAGQDVTPAFVAATDRLSAARAERRGLLRRLERATTDAQADAIRRRLDATSVRIDRLRRELRTMRERTDYAAVTVTLVEASDDEGGAGAGGTGEAFDDALGLLVGSLNLALRALGVLIPLGLVAGLGWIAGRSVRRRRREAVLQ